MTQRRKNFVGIGRVSIVLFIHTLQRHTFTFTLYYVMVNHIGFVKIPFLTKSPRHLTSYVLLLLLNNVRQHFVLEQHIYYIF